MPDDLPTPRQVYQRVADMLARATATPVASAQIDDDGEICPCTGMSIAAIAAAAAGDAGDAERGPLFSTLADGLTLE